MNQPLSDAIISANKHSFAEQAASYDRCEVCMGRHARSRIVEDVARLAQSITSPQPVALDCGTGTGNLALEFLKSGFRVVGVDLSLEMLDVLRTKVSGFGEMQKGLELINQDIESFLNGRPDQFDVVACCSFLHHLPDYVAVLETLCSRVKPLGFLYVAWEPLPRRHRTYAHRLLVALDVSLSLLSRDPIGFLLTVPKQVHQAIRSALGKPCSQAAQLVDVHVPSGLDVHRIEQVIRDNGCEIVTYRQFSGRRLAFFQVIADKVLMVSDQFSIVARRSP